MAEIPARSCVAKSGQAFVIRCATPDDALALIAHSRAIISEGTGVIRLPEEFATTIDEEKTWIDDHFLDPSKLAIMAELDSELIGLLGAEARPQARLAHTGTIFLSVASQWRDRGVGTALMETVIDWAAHHPRIEKLDLAVLATNVPAIRLYRRLGFVEEGRRKCQVKLAEGEYVDDLLMAVFVKPLADSTGCKPSPRGCLSSDY